MTEVTKNKKYVCLSVYELSQWKDMIEKYQDSIIPSESFEDIKCDTKDRIEKYNINHNDDKLSDDEFSYADGSREIEVTNKKGILVFGIHTRVIRRFYE